MHWNEKIDLVKNKFSPAEFKDPFRTGKNIIDKIIQKLHNASFQKFEQTVDKETLIKDGILLKTCNVQQLYKEELPKLPKDNNVWLLLVQVPMGSGLKIYDCQYEALRELVYLSSGLSKQDFYIVDKKYAWLLYVKIDHESDLVSIHQS